MLVKALVNCDYFKDNEEREPEKKAFLRYGGMESAVHLAVKAGYVQVVAFLLKSGALPDNRLID